MISLRLCFATARGRVHPKINKGVKTFHQVTMHRRNGLSNIPSMKGIQRILPSVLESCLYT